MRKDENGIHDWEKKVQPFVLPVFLILFAIGIYTGFIS